jgi:PhzF family phenazine biosynthesis protein
VTLPFRQVDVFSDEPLRGNPVAVVHDADGLSDEQMQAFARWTNLSETTFLLAPTDTAADYRVRIFTPGGELPFAGHPTLGTAHAWLEAGGRSKGDRVVQECGVGLVELRRDGARLAFAAPGLLRAGPVSEEQVARIAAGLQIRPDEIVDAQWVDNGPGWVAVLLADASAVLAVRPDPVALGDLAVGVVRGRGPGVRRRARRGRGPGDGVPQRGSRAVAHRQRHAPVVVRRLPGHRPGPARARARLDRRGRPRLGRRGHADHRPGHRRDLT